MANMRLLKMDRAEYRALVRAAMKWWRARHPEYRDVRVISHGWYGHAVSAIYYHERKIVDRVGDIVEAYEKFLREGDR